MSQATRTEDNLINFAQDAVVGMVAGAAGTLLLGLIFYSGIQIGVLGESLRRLGSFLYLDLFLPQPLAGLVTFALGGVVFWPLIFASLEARIPGGDRPVKGAVFSFVLWLGFLVGFYRAGGTPNVGLYALYTGAGHLIYGVTLGEVFDRFVSDAHEQRVTQLGAVSGPAPGEPAAAAAATGDADAGAVAPAGTSAATPPDVGEDDETTRVVFEGEDDLPPLLQFGDAINRLESILSGDYEELDRLRSEYDSLAGGDESNRSSVVSSIRYTVTSLEERVLASEDPETAADAEKWLGSITNCADQYLDTRSKTSETLHISGFDLSIDGEQRPVSEMQGEVADVQATVVNQGEPSGAVITVDFYPAEEDVLLRSVDLSVGNLPAGGRDSIDTTVHVPSIAESYEARVSDPREGQQFLPDF